MKKLLQIIVLIGMMMLSYFNIKAQVTTPFNIGGIGDYVGWDGSTNMPLDIKTKNSTYPQPINFYTNDGWPRMQIYDSLNIPNAGNVAIGYFSLMTNGPQSLLHMDQASDSANY